MPFQFVLVCSRLVVCVFPDYYDVVDKFPLKGHCMGRAK